MTSQADALRDGVHRRQASVVELLGDLVAQNSTESGPGVQPCMDIIERRLESIVTTVEHLTFDGLPARVFRFGGGDSNDGIAFACHVDVVPADSRSWKADPFALTEIDGRLYGRGTTDMKGGIAACVTALDLLAELDLLGGLSVELVLTGDEEVGSDRGMQPLVRSGVMQSRRAVCCEPTGLDVFLGNRGVVWLDITITGRAGHAGLPQVAKNPIEAIAALVPALHAIPLQAHDPRFAPPTPSVTVTKVVADGGARNAIPHIGELTIDRRLLPGEDIDAAIAQITQAVDVALGSTFEVQTMVARRWPAYALEPGARISDLAIDAVRTVGRPARTAMDSATDDSSWLGQAGIPTILLGPGAPEQAHAVDEHVEFRELIDTVEVYAQLMLSSSLT